MSDLVFAALAALGPAANRREVALVAMALRESGDTEALAVFGLDQEPDSESRFDQEACAAVTEIAVRAGAGGFVALDLYTEMVAPGWSPFPAGDWRLGD